LHAWLRFNPLQEFVSVPIGDISEGGLFLRMDHGRHKVGQMVSVRLEAGEERTVRSSARIVRLTATGLGLQFVDLDDASRKLIATMVRIKLAAREY
jgi:c-di-GMP-binding flagellar brake protein YcgR